MMRSVYLKTLYDKRWFMFGWTLGLMALTALMVVFYPAMHQDGSLDALVKNMPPAFQGLVGSLSDLNSFDTYLASQLFDIRMPLIAGIMAIILALGLSTAEEERGELRTLLSLPLSRVKLLLEKWLALCTIMAVTVLGVVVAIYMVGPFIEGGTIEPTALLGLVFMTWLIMVVFGSVTLTAGFATGSRAVANTLSILIVIGSFVLTTFGQAVDWLKEFEKFSLLHYFPAADIVRNGVDTFDVMVFSLVIVVSLVVAIIVFRRRDIA